MPPSMDEKSILGLVIIDMSQLVQRLSCGGSPCIFNSCNSNHIDCGIMEFWHSDLRSLISGLWSLVSGLWALISDLWSLVSDLWSFGFVAICFRVDESRLYSSGACAPSGVTIVAR